MHPVAECARCGLFRRCSIRWEWCNYTTCDQTQPCHARPPALHLWSKRRDFFFFFSLETGRPRRGSFEEKICFWFHKHFKINLTLMLAHKLLNMTVYVQTRKRIVTLRNIGLFPIRLVSPGSSFRDCGWLNVSTPLDFLPDAPAFVY